MKLELNANDKRILVTNEKPQCCICGEETLNKLFFCEEMKKLYCYKCQANKRGCSGINREHIDWTIDEVRYTKK